MSVRNYMQTCITPYRLLDDAMALIDQLCVGFDRDTEEKAIVLINAASLHPSMSTYQLSMAHKALADCYFEHNFRGSALVHYRRGLGMNGRLPVKRRIQQLEAIPRTDLLQSASPDLIEDVLRFPEYVELVEADRRKTAELRSAYSDEPKDLFDSEEDRLAAIEKARQELREKLEQEDATYDPSFEAEISRRLDALGEPYKTEFYRIREQTILSRRGDEPLSQRETDLLNLQAMERSAAFRGE